MEPVSASTAVSVVKAAGAVANEVTKTGLPARLFGPLFDEVGATWADGFRRRNLEKIAKKAERMAKKAARPSQLEVPQIAHPRVVLKVLREGSLCDDDVTQAYLAGLVRGSQSEDGADDRAVYYVDLLTRMTAGQVRLHHAIYTALASGGPSEYYGEETFLWMRTVYSPLEAAATVLQHPDDVDSEDALTEALVGLNREGLVSNWAVAERERFDSVPVENNGTVMMAQPTHLGIMLALWAHGIRDAVLERIIETEDCDFDPPGPSFEKWGFKIDQQQIQNLSQPLIT